MVQEMDKPTSKLTIQIFADTERFVADIERAKNIAQAPIAIPVSSHEKPC